MTSAEATLRAHLLKHPLDTGAHLALADAMADAGDERAAILYRIIHDAGNDDWRLQYATLLERETPERVECPKCRKGKSGVLRCYRCHKVVEETHEHHSGEEHDGTWSCNRVDRCSACNGTGEVIDTSHTDRAAYIRCQVELATCGPCPATIFHSEFDMPDHGGKMYVMPPPIPPKEPCGRCPVCKLRARESELLTANRTRWLPKCQFCAGTGATYPVVGGPCPQCKGTRHAGDMRCGFLASVEVPTLEHTLAKCAVCSNGYVPTDRDDDTCELCKGKVWMATDFARDLFRGEWGTCQAIVAKDREPHIEPHTYRASWRRGPAGPGSRRDWLPDALFYALKGFDYEFEYHVKEWPTDSAAKTALATALCDTLRALCAGET